MRSPRFDVDGAQLRRGLANPHLDELLEFFASTSVGPGTRIADAGSLEFICGPDSAVGTAVRDLIGSRARVVRAIAFDKSPETNWALGWHQDRTICVKRRATISGYGPWTLKQGLHHVQPPFAITAGMVTVRVHLDPVTPDNAPLKIALGTHQLGQIADADAHSVAKRHATTHCYAQPGDVWFYSTPILHASDRSRASGRRRVLQLDFSADDLPSPLQWLLESQTVPT